VFHYNMLIIIVQMMKYSRMLILILSVLVLLMKSTSGFGGTNLRFNMQTMGRLSHDQRERSKIASIEHSSECSGFKSFATVSEVFDEECPLDIFTKYLVPQVPEPSSCCQICKDDLDCEGFVFVRDRCYLKNCAAFIN
jgi:hypothetical protein